MAAKKPPQITSLADFNEPKNILVYGDAGVGKTPFGATSPTGLMVTTEAGTVSALRLGGQCDVWPCHDSWDEFVKMYRWVHDTPDHGYEWLIIDNATQLQEIMLRSIVATARASNSNRDEDIPAIQDYQKWYLMFDRFVKAVNNLPVNTLWLAHSMRRADDEGNDLFMPAIQGQDFAQAQKFCGRMQAIGFMEERRVKKGDATIQQRRILWRKNQNYTAKDRYIFKKDIDTRYTIVSEGDVPKTDMAEISRRIDAALAEGSIKTAKTAAAKKPAAKKAAPRTATRRAAK